MKNVDALIAAATRYANARQAYIDHGETQPPDNARKSVTYKWYNTDYDLEQEKNAAKEALLRVAWKFKSPK